MLLGEKRRGLVAIRSNIGAEAFALRAKMKRAKERLREYKGMLEKENFREKKDEESR